MRSADLRTEKSEDQKGKRRFGTERSEAGIISFETRTCAEDSEEEDAQLRFLMSCREA